MAESAQEKTEAPTPRRLSEARQEGNVAKSQDLTAAVSLLAAVLLLLMFGRHVFVGMAGVVEAMLSDVHANNVTTPGHAGPMMSYAGWMTVVIVAPIVLGVTAAAILGNVFQVGFLLTTKPLELDIKKLNPIKGAANLFNARAGVRLLMSLAKVGIISSVGIWAIQRDLPVILMLAELEALPLFVVGCQLVFALALKLALLLLLLALIDYSFQKWQRMRDLRMSKQDMKEELKRMEGDPMIKQRRARVARQLAMQRISSAVPQADVIVTNPTHFAIALKYDSATMTAPKVIAKGADFLALRIRQLAVVHGVPMVERKELARNMYSSVEVGQEVPPEFYNAIAEILAYVYRLSERKSA